jgi:hypothetical protein
MRIGGQSVDSYACSGDGGVPVAAARLIDLYCMRFGWTSAMLQAASCS